VKEARELELLADELEEGIKKLEGALTTSLGGTDGP
jgi:hypothetical protein